jgi:hypothetical protein
LKRPLKLIHTDICEQINSCSFNERRYFITFIDGFFEAFITFKKFKVIIEKSTRCNVQTLRSDRGGEYMTNEFKTFCENKGVHST